MLGSLGLDSVTEAVYRGMLGHPQVAAADLARVLGLTEAQLSQAVDQLTEMGLVRLSPQPRAVPPAAGMEILLSRQMDTLTAEQRRLETSRLAAARLIAEYTAPRSSSLSGVEELVGLDRVRDRLAELAHGVQHETLSFTPDGMQTAENRKASAPLDDEVLDRGVTMRWIVLDSMRNDPATYAYTRQFAERGAETRSVASLPIRMLIFDRTHAVLPLRADDTAAGAVVLTGHGMLTALCALFECVWATARPLGQPASRDHRGLTSQEKTVISLLCEGQTDEAIARQLGVSARTVRRVVGELMAELGARSRFEAGVRAAARGWAS